MSNMYTVPHVTWLFVVITYRAHMSIHLPYKPINYLTYMPYMPNLVAIFSSSYMAVT